MGKWSALNDSVLRFLLCYVLDILIISGLNSLGTENVFRRQSKFDLWQNQVVIVNGVAYIHILHANVHLFLPFLQL